MSDGDTLAGVGWVGDTHSGKLAMGLEANAGCIQCAGTAVIELPTGLCRSMPLVQFAYVDAQENLGRHPPALPSWHLSLDNDR